jgi:hypothetical protein
MPALMNAAGFSNREHYQAYLRGLLEKAQQVEDLFWCPMWAVETWFNHL